MTITLAIVRGLIAQAKASGYDTNSGCWLVRKCRIYNEVTLSNHEVIFGSNDNA